VVADVGTVNEMSCCTEVSQYWLIVFVTQTLEIEYVTVLASFTNTGPIYP